ncbi:hypothetical protein [Mycobacterium celatum]|uniref:hypothetical protein n=1 Tax=Mycobacterium celatum TaxID=28045 RepID=UPI0012EDBC43|nr:hypothetical protein [Mycobacterium celatum]
MEVFDAAQLAEHLDGGLGGGQVAAVVEGALHLEPLDRAGVAGTVAQLSKPAAQCVDGFAVLLVGEAAVTPSGGDPHGLRHQHGCRAAGLSVPQPLTIAET